MSDAPTIRTLTKGRTRTEIVNRSSHHVLTAEYDLRSWQALITAYKWIDIDFENAAVTYEAESPDEREHIKIHSLSKKKSDVRVRGGEEFAIYGRAFLAHREGAQFIEVMSLYNDAQKAQLAARWIDAYNAYYSFSKHSIAADAQELKMSSWSS